MKLPHDLEEKQEGVEKNGYESQTYLRTYNINIGRKWANGNR